MDPRVCQRIQDQLQRFLDGELAEAAQEEVQAHVEACPECREELQQLAQVISILDETIGPEPAPPGWTAGVLQRARRYGPLTGWQGRLKGWTRGDRLRLYLETALVMLFCWLWMEHPWNPTVSPLELEIVNRPQWLCGSTAAVRVLARNTATQEPLRNAWIRLWLSGEPGRHILYTGRTNERGTIDAYFRLPERFDPGTYRLTVEIRSPQGQERLEQPVQLRRDYRLWLATDRPAYLPGQSIRLRLWAYDRGTQRPAEGQKVSLEALDPRGNRIWQTEQRINADGAAKAECALDGAALQGRYTVRASISQTATERGVWVGEDRRPKFQVRLSPEQPFYAPGAVMRGQIEARYPGGQAVRQGVARVSVWLPGAAAPVAQWRGTTDGRGQATWRLPLPRSLPAGQSPQAALQLRLVAVVQDADSQTQTVQQSMALASSPFRLEVIPENGTWVPGVENILYFVARSPDGNPWEVEWEVRPPGRRAGTVLSAPAGVAEYHWQPGRSPERFTLIARDRAGRQAILQWSRKECRPAAYPFLLRTDRAFYRAGDTVHVTVLTPRSGAVYLEVLQADQIVLTESLDVYGGRGTLAFDLPPEVSGLLTLQAYSLEPPPAWHDGAFIYVMPARQLRVALAAEPENDRRRAEASVRLTVTGSDGEPAAATVGLTLTQEGPAGWPADSLRLFPALFLGDLGPWDGLPEPVAGPTFLEAVAQAGWSAASLPWQQRWVRALWARQPLPPWDRPHRQNNGRAKIERAQRTQRRFLHALRFYGLAAGICGSMVLLWWSGRRLSWGLEPWLDRWRFHRPPPAAGPRWRRKWAVAILSCGLVAGGALGYGMGRSRSAQPSRLAAVRWARWEAPSQPFHSPPRPAPRGRKPSGAPGAAPAASRETPPLRQGASQKASPAPLPFAGAAAPPETFWTQPALIPVEEGQARIQVPLPDPPAPWRVTAWASSRSGEVGVGEAVLRVSRDFRLQVDLPSRLTRLDEIALPVTLFNYRDQPQKIGLTVKPLEKPGTGAAEESADRFLLRSQRLALDWLREGFIPRPAPQVPSSASPWCTFLQEPARTVTVPPQGASVTYFRLRAERPGSHALSVLARSATAEEAVEREVVVQPRGQVCSRAFNGRLVGSPVTRTLILPSPAVPGAGQVRVKVYPGLLSQIWEDLAVLWPSPAANCEQVASAIRVRARLLKALPHSSVLPPERREQVERELHLAYQKLLAFEEVDAQGRPTGGFGWSGSDPPQAWLTALALQALTDLSACRPVDPAVLRRLRHWLRQHQEPQGSWQSPRRLATTAWVVGALAGDSPEAPALQKARRYLQEQMASTWDPYNLALGVLALRAVEPDHPAARQALQRLLDLRRAEGNQVFWRPSQPTLTQARGPAADLETSALAVLALQPMETSPEVVERALTYLLNRRQPGGGWGSSQATGLCLQALLGAFQAHPLATASGQVTVRVGASEEHSLRLSRRERMAFQEVDISSQISPGSNAIQLSFRGSGQPFYQIVSAVEQPWNPRSPELPALDLQVAYPPSRSAAGKPLACRLRVRNRGPEEAHQVRAEIGLPPGFEADLALLRREIPKSVRRCALENQSLILIWDRLRPGEEQTLRCRFKPSFPGRVQTPPARILETYTPSSIAYAPPVQVSVD
jgi:5-hydroxyisourate hydrolase-like protein (transthyretin family)